MRAGHSVDFKKAAVERFLSRGNRKAEEIAKESGVDRRTLYQWSHEFANVADMKKQSKPQDRSVAEKLKNLMEYNALPLEKRGEYLRKNGLHEEKIKEWEMYIEEALSSNKKISVNKSELISEQKKVKVLEREIRRKEKALAEAAALLLLKKKADLIWGTEEDE